MKIVLKSEVVRGSFNPLAFIMKTPQIMTLGQSMAREWRAMTAECRAIMTDSTCYTPAAIMSVGKSPTVNNSVGPQTAIPQILSQKSVATASKETPFPGETSFLQLEKKKGTQADEANETRNPKSVNNQLPQAANNQSQTAFEQEVSSDPSEKKQISKKQISFSALTNILGGTGGATGKQTENSFGRGTEGKLTEKRSKTNLQNWKENLLKFKNDLLKFKSNLENGTLFEGQPYSRPEIALCVFLWLLSEIICVLVNYIEHLAVPFFIVMSTSPYFTGEKGLPTAILSTITTALLGGVFFLALDGMRVYINILDTRTRNTMNQKTGGKLRGFPFFRCQLFAFLIDMSSVIGVYIEFYLRRKKTDQDSILVGATRVALVGVIFECIDVAWCAWFWTKDCGRYLPENCDEDGIPLESSEAPIIIKTVDIKTVDIKEKEEAAVIINDSINKEPENQKETDSAQNESTQKTESGKSTNSSKSDSNQLVKMSTRERRHFKRLVQLAVNAKKASKRVFKTRAGTSSQDNLSVLDNLSAKYHEITELREEEKNKESELQEEENWSPTVRKEVFRNVISATLWTLSWRGWKNVSIFATKDILVPLADYVRRYFDNLENINLENTVQTGPTAATGPIAITEKSDTTASVDIEKSLGLLFNQAFLFMFAVYFLKAYFDKCLNFMIMDIRRLAVQFFNDKGMPMVKQFYPYGWTAGIHWLAFLIGMLCYHPMVSWDFFLGGSSETDNSATPTHRDGSLTSSEIGPIPAHISNTVSNTVSFPSTALLAVGLRTFARVFQQRMKYIRWVENRKQAGKFHPERPLVLLYAETVIKWDSDDAGKNKGNLRVIPVLDDNGRPVIKREEESGMPLFLVDKNKKPIHVDFSDVDYDVLGVANEKTCHDLCVESLDIDKKSTTDNNESKVWKKTSSYFLSMWKEAMAAVCCCSAKYKSCSYSGEDKLFNELVPVRVRESKFNVIDNDDDDDNVDNDDNVFDEEALKIDPDALFLLWNPWEELQNESKKSGSPMTFSEVACFPMKQTFGESSDSCLVQGAMKGAKGAASCLGKIRECSGSSGARSGAGSSGPVPGTSLSSSIDIDGTSVKLGGGNGPGRGSSSKSESNSVNANSVNANSMSAVNVTRKKTAPLFKLVHDKSGKYLMIQRAVQGADGDVLGDNHGDGNHDHHGTERPTSRHSVQAGSPLSGSPASSGRRERTESQKASLLSRSKSSAAELV